MISPLAGNTADSILRRSALGLSVSDLRARLDEIRLSLLILRLCVFLSVFFYFIFLNKPLGFGEFRRRSGRAEEDSV